MPLQSFKASDGSTVFYDPTTKKIMTEGGTRDSFYSANSLDDATNVWNQRLANRNNGGNSNPVQESGNSGNVYGGGAPSIDLNKVYETALNSDEIKNLKTEIDMKKQGLNQAMTSINDNPFASEATRLGKLRRLDESAGREVQTLEANLAQKTADAQVKVNIATQQYNIESQQYQNNLSRLNTLISSGALLNATGSDLAEIALSTGLTTTMVKSIQDKMKSDQIQPQVITNTDNNGKVTVSVIDSRTGEVISQNSLGNIGGANTSGGGGNQYKAGTPTYISAVNAMTQDLQTVMGEDKRVSPNDYTGYRQEWVQAGFDPSDFDANFKGFINPTHAQDYLVGYSSPNKDLLEELYSRGRF